MRVIAMFRVSTEKQANEGASLDAQERVFRGLVAQHHWTVVEEFRGCESATQAATERRVLQQVLASVREHEPDALYVHEQSRLTRGDELDVALLLRELRERRLKIIVGGVVRDLGSIDERFMIGIQSLVDRAETERMRERVGRGRRERALQGRKNNGPDPYGYSNPHRGDPRRGTLQIMPELAPIVRRIFELSARGVGNRTIAKRLNADCVPSPRGVLWCKTAIERVLTNPVYIGVHASYVWITPKGVRKFRLDLANPKAILVENAHAPIIERAVWDAVHNRPRSPRTPKPRLLTGFLRINGQRSTSDSIRGDVFYRGARGTRGLPWLHVAETDRVVWEGFVRAVSEPAFVEAVMQQANGQRSKSDLKATLARHEAKQAKCRKRLDGLTNMRADGEISREEFLTRSEQLTKELQAAEAEAAKIRASLAGADPSDVERAVGAVRLLLGENAILDVAQRRAILRSVVRHVDVEAAPTGNRQHRAALGAYAGSGGPRWRIKGASVTLGVPTRQPDGLKPTFG